MWAHKYKRFPTRTPQAPAEAMTYPFPHILEVTLMTELKAKWGGRAFCYKMVIT